MVTYLLVYFSVGILLNLTGPIASGIRNEMKYLRMKPPQSQYDPDRKLLLAEIILRSLLLCIYPFAYTMWFIDLYYRRKGPSPVERKRHEKVRMEIQKVREKRKTDLLANKTFVFFRDSRGGGTIRCHGCGFRQGIVSFTNGRDYMPHFARGFQCQKCGKFHQVQFLGHRLITPFLRCSCGGELSNIKPIFCPKCKARDVHYVLEYVT
jgi:hypothetical protein